MSTVHGTQLKTGGQHGGGILGGGGRGDRIGGGTEEIEGPRGGRVFSREMLVAHVQLHLLHLNNLCLHY